MTHSIRAEDFDIQDDILILGGRVLERSAILSYFVHGRTSLESLGMIGLIAALGYGFVNSLSMPVAAGGIAVGVCVLLFGLLREYRRRFVLSLQLYQIGKFEVRGLTIHEARLVTNILDAGISFNSASPKFRSSGDHGC